MSSDDDSGYPFIFKQLTARINAAAYAQQSNVVCGDEFEPQDVSDLLDKLVVKFPHHAMFVMCRHAPGVMEALGFEHLGDLCRKSSTKSVYFRLHEQAETECTGIHNRFDCTCLLWNGQEIATTASLQDVSGENGMWCLVFAKPIMVVAEDMPCADLYIKLTCAGMRIGDGAFRLNASRFFYSRADDGATSKQWTRYWFKDHVVHVLSGFTVASHDRFQCHYMDDYHLLLKLCRALHLMLKSKCKIIQRAWRNCISNPAFKMCRKRLLREFGSDV